MVSGLSYDLKAAIAGVACWLGWPAVCRRLASLMCSKVWCCCLCLMPYPMWWATLTSPGVPFFWSLPSGFDRVLAAWSMEGSVNQTLFLHFEPGWLVRDSVGYGDDAPF